MRDPARVQAAIEVLVDVEDRKRPASDALKDWGLSHRFAGSSDRAAISQIVYDALRTRASSCWMMQEDSPRAAVIGALRQIWDLSTESITALFDPSFHGPIPLTDREIEALSADNPFADAPEHVQADVPEWLAPSLSRAFSGRLIEEGRAMARRAPIDLRINTLASGYEKAAAALQRFGPQTLTLAPLGLRIPAPAGGAKAPHVESDPAYLKGWVEVQDEASQIVAALAGARAGMQVADVCAGSGGKTLALAADMENRGQIYAYDVDGRRLAPLRERMERACARNIQIRHPGAGNDALTDLFGRMDVTLVDAPCTGSGTWRRRPDAKWRMRPGALTERRQDQVESLDLGAKLVKPGGILLYVTCSLLPQENEDQIAAFLARWQDFSPVKVDDRVRELFPPGQAMRLNQVLTMRTIGAQLSPARSNTDGFYFAVLRRAVG